MELRKLIKDDDGMVQVVIEPETVGECADTVIEAVCEGLFSARTITPKKTLLVIGLVPKAEVARIIYRLKERNVQVSPFHEQNALDMAMEEKEGQLA